MATEWKIIPGYPDYEASTDGRIRTVRERDGTPNDKGYLTVRLTKKGQKAKTVYLHRMVAFTHLGEPPEGMNVINHKDGNPKNNRVDNLEWTDHRGNNLHRYRNHISAKDRADWSLWETLCG